MTKKTSPAYRASKEETIPINKLHPFSNHPFHIRHNLEFSELVDSISESGIITPIIVRPKVGVGYEVISGHRRWEACKELGIESIPARVEYIDDDEATILMVNSNIQREHVLPSEKAFAYKMRMEALKHQGRATLAQVGPKFSSEKIAAETGDSRNQVKRYIRLTYLIPSILQMVDDGRIAFNPAVEISYMTGEHQTSSKSHINPMDISEDYGDEGNPIQLKSQFLRDFCQLVLNSKELSAQECSLVDRAALITYQKYLLHPEREQMPSLHDFYNNLSLQGPQAKALTMALSMYVDGTMDLFAHQTNVDLQNHCICFNTVKLGKSMQSIGMMTVLDQIWNRITRNRVLGRRTWIFTDEFQLLLGNSACTNYYFELSSRARKWGAILTSITQHVRSVLNNEDARRMLSDCGYIKLLNQAPDDANDIARLLHISDEEKRYIENAEVGRGLLIADKVVVPFNNTFPQDTELFRLMDTNPNRKK